MAIMKKPASHHLDWGQAVNDNWSSIEANLVDKSILTAKGDLLAATGPSAPAKLGVGADAQILVSDSTQAAGLTWQDVGTIMRQTLWGRKFFKDGGFLPSKKMFEYFGTPPAFAGTSGLATWTRNPGVASVDNSGIAWYDLGVPKSRILVVVGNIQRGSLGGFDIHLTPDAPTGLNPDGYSVAFGNSGPLIQKHLSGAYTTLVSSSGLSSVDYVTGHALYYDDASDTLTTFLRQNNQWWFQVASGTSATFTTLRYVALQSANANTRFSTPFVCYAE